MSEFRFTLFVAGTSPRSLKAIADLRRICEDLLRGVCEMRVVDVTAEPDAAEAERILTTPTVVKEHPAPRRRVTGDLSHPQRVLEGLGIEPDRLSPTPEAR